MMVDDIEYQREGIGTKIFSPPNWRFTRQPQRGFNMVLDFQSHIFSQVFDYAYDNPETIAVVCG
ncbi:hypothetical protein [Streptomyces sp. NBC_00623]|uniref:hypothetical protein n=1 Tax=Streptomyces sp. NBC_00623 TaxID=2975790 RepID=UPI0030E5DA47